MNTEIVDEAMGILLDRHADEYAEILNRCEHEFRRFGGFNR